MTGSQHTIRWALAQAIGWMLCFVAVFAMGCASENFQRTGSSLGTTHIQPAQMNRNVRVPAQGETEIQQPKQRQAPEHAPPATSAPIEQTPSVSTDIRAAMSPALALMVSELDASIDACPRSQGLEHTITLVHLRNMSHATAHEFDALRSRLAELLNAAAGTSGSSLHVVAGDDELAPFEVLGAAYLTTAQGFDVWELFLSASRKDVPYDLWRSNGPVRILRFEQPMSAQVFYPGTSRH